MTLLQQEAITSTLTVRDAAIDQQHQAAQQLQDAAAATTLLAHERNAAIAQHEAAMVQFEDASAVRSATIRHAAAAQTHAALMHFEGGYAAGGMIAHERDALIAEQQVAVLQLQRDTVACSMVAHERDAALKEQQAAIRKFESGAVPHCMTRQGPDATQRALMHAQEEAAAAAQIGAITAAVVQSEQMPDNTIPQDNPQEEQQPDAMSEFVEAAALHNHAHHVVQQSAQIVHNREAALGQLRGDQRPAAQVQFLEAAAAAQMQAESEEQGLAAAGVGESTTISCSLFAISS